MSSHPSHHASLPRLSDSGSMSYPGPSSYQYPPPPSQHQHEHQHQHQHQQHQHQQHQQQPPPPASSISSSGHSSHQYYPSHNSQSIGNHHGPGNPGIGVSDLYHPSPIGAPPSTPSNNSVPSLPSMRTIDPLHPPPSSSLHSSPYPGPPNLPPGPLPFFSMPPPYGIQPHGLPSFSNYGHHHGHVNDLRMPSYTISALRHKKEIKRRTKTGCMTCRKRRIKCDETHPTCNNCKKSKRDCAGYDPIFKQQPNNPAFLQATVHVSPHGSSTTTTSAPAARPKSPPPLPYSSVATSSAASSTATNLAGIKSPSVIGGPSSLSSTSSSSGSAVSNYYNATGPPSSNSSSYQPNHTNNGSSNHHETNGNSGHGSSSSYNPSIYSSRSIVSPTEYPGSSFDPVFKEESRRNYWAGRVHHGYPSSTPDSRDTARYSQGLL